MNLTWKELEGKLKDYVTLDRYSPVEKIVYGMVGLILISVAGAIISLVIRATK